ncbi:hypothetical protein OSTOST_11866, partial [Ostertagia ostertagi]
MAKQGACNSLLKGYFEKECPKSCKICGDGDEEVTTSIPETTPKPPPKEGIPARLCERVNKQQPAVMHYYSLCLALIFGSVAHDGLINAATASKCADTVSNCPNLANQISDGLVNAQATTPGADATPTLPSQETTTACQCKDILSNCEDSARLGACSGDFKEFRKKMSQKKECVDRLDNCKRMAEQGECHGRLS